MNTQPPDWLDAICWNREGLVPVTVQDSDNGRILMQAWMNRESLEKTVQTGQAVYWSRSRKQLWHKGETSGHVQIVEEVRTDCDRDSLLLQVRQTGGVACHTGRYSCFFLKLEQGRWETTEPVLKDPDLLYPPSK